MKIAIWHNLPSGGANRAMAGHVRALVARGHTVEIWYPPTANTTYLPLGDVAVEHAVPMVTSRGGRRLRWPFPPPAVVNARAVLDGLTNHCRRCGEQIMAGGFDLVLAQEARLVPAPPLPQFVSIPTVLYMQQPNRLNFEQTFTPGTLPWIGDKMLTTDCIRHPKRLARAVMEQYLVRFMASQENQWAKEYDLVLANSLFSRESILRAYGVDAKVCYLGVDLSKFSDRRLPRERLVIGLGEVGPHKNVELAIRGVAAMPAPGAPLVWVSNNVHDDYGIAMGTLAAQLGVEFRVAAKLPDEQVVELLNRATAMIYTSRLEPFGLAPLEANACGTPVVAVAEGGVRETIRDGVNGLLVESEPAAIGEALGRLLADPALARRLGDGGVREVGDRWTESAGGERLERRLLALLAKGGQKHDA